MWCWQKCREYIIHSHGKKDNEELHLWYEYLLDIIVMARNIIQQFKTSQSVQSRSLRICIYWRLHCNTSGLQIDSLHGLMFSLLKLYSQTTIWFLPPSIGKQYVFCCYTCLMLPLWNMSIIRVFFVTLKV
jgi:hypothetical protein